MKLETLAGSNSAAHLGKTELDRSDEVSDLADVDPESHSRIKDPCAIQVHCQALREVPHPMYHATHSRTKGTSFLGT